IASVSFYLSNSQSMKFFTGSFAEGLQHIVVTDAGDKIWRDFFATPPANTPLSAESYRRIKEVFVFSHRPEVSRVIFISTPPRGSPLATSWVGRFGASLVKPPQSLKSIYAEINPHLVADSTAAPFNRMPNSVDTLEPNDGFVRAVNRIPTTPGVPYHSIMGDRGRGDTPNSSD